MESRFLAGEDAAFVDYASIDTNAQLDDHWLEQRGRDAEDAYFDSEDAGCDNTQPTKAVGKQNSMQIDQPQVQEGLEEWERMEFT